MPMVPSLFAATVGTKKSVLVYQFTFRILKHFICTKQTRHKSGQIRSYSKDYANVVPIHMDTILAKT